MKYRKQTASGDYSFGNGLSDFYINSPEAVAQSVKTRLLLWVNEWFLDTEEGTYWLQGVIGKQDQETRDTVIRSRILETEGVTGISDYSTIIDSDNRTLSIAATIDTLYGTTTIQVTQ